MFIEVVALLTFVAWLVLIFDVLHMLDEGGTKASYITAVVAGTIALLLTVNMIWAKSVNFEVDRATIKYALVETSEQDDKITEQKAKFNDGSEHNVLTTFGYLFPENTVIKKYRYNPWKSFMYYSKLPVKFEYILVEQIGDHPDIPHSIIKEIEGK